MLTFPAGTWVPFTEVLLAGVVVPVVLATEEAPVALVLTDETERLTVFEEETELPDVVVVPELLELIRLP